MGCLKQSYTDYLRLLTDQPAANPKLQYLTAQEQAAQNTDTIRTQTVSSAGLKNVTRSTFSVLWESAVIQQFRVGTERQDLDTKGGVRL